MGGRNSKPLEALQSGLEGLSRLSRLLSRLP
jgi:hypothetical protein